MNKSQEKVLVASLCGIIVAAAAGFAVQPAMASDYAPKVSATGAGTPVVVERYNAVIPMNDREI